jgi:adenosylcobinamide-GDP ribazoletransferase
MEYFILMVRFFTRIPIKTTDSPKEMDFSKGLLFFPLVGLIIGIFNFLIFYIFSFWGVNLLSSVFWLLANTVITGALHIDGLADTCDGLLSYRDKDIMLEIMKDSRIGTNGVIAIFMDFLLRLSLILSLSGRTVPYVILVSPILGKTVLLLLIWLTPYARKTGGIGGMFYKDISRKSVILGAMSGVFLLILLFSWKVYAVLILCFVTMFFYRKFVINKIGGMTGDTLGAANELAEIAFMLYILIFERFGFI